MTKGLGLDRLHADPSPDRKVLLLLCERKHGLAMMVGDGATAIDVIDGPRLCDLLKEQGLGVRTEMVEEVSIDPDWFKTV